MSQKPDSSHPSQKEKEDFIADPSKPADELTDLTTLMVNIWKKWRYWIMAVIVLSGLSLISWKSVQLIQKKLERSIQTSFEEAIDEKEKLSFTKQYPKTSQAGIIYLQMANDRYRTEKYAEAAVYYQKAENILPSPFKGRALIGQAMALLQSTKNKDKIKGEGLLETITKNSTLLDTIRAQAAYNQALIYWDRDDFPAVKKSLVFIENLEQAGILWLQKAQNFRRKIP